MSRSRQRCSSRARRSRRISPASTASWASAPARSWPARWMPAPARSSKELRHGDGRELVRVGDDRLGYRFDVDEADRRGGRALPPAAPGPDKPFRQPLAGHDEALAGVAEVRRIERVERPSRLANGPGSEAMPFSKSLTIWVNSRGHSPAFGPLP